MTWLRSLDLSDCDRSDVFDAPVESDGAELGRCVSDAGVMALNCPGLQYLKSLSHVTDASMRALSDFH